MYALLDTQTGEWHVTPKGKFTWSTSGAAKLALLANPPEWFIKQEERRTGKRYYASSHTFDCQTRAVACEVDMVVLRRMP